MQLISDRGAIEIFKSFKNFQYIHFLPIRKLDDIIKNFIQLITPSKHRGSGFLIAKNKMKVLILCAGIGSRLGYLTKNSPKCL